MAVVLGADGCPGGWVAAVLDGDAPVRWLAGSFADLLAVGADVVAVDVPVGLPDGPPRRAADGLARARLGRRGSCVFPTPVRAVLEAPDQPTATLLSRASGSTGISVQLWNILDKIAEVDAALRGAPGLVDRVVEVHPEVSFAALAGRPLPRKTTATGRAERLAALASWRADAAVPVPRPGRARPDDCLDALACAWSGGRWLAGDAEVLGDETDGVGLPMRIVV